jgi:hypothetical protein
MRSRSMRSVINRRSSGDSAVQTAVATFFFFSMERAGCARVARRSDWPASSVAAPPKAGPKASADPFSSATSSKARA